jgi:hypothetical protein
VENNMLHQAIHQEKFPVLDDILALLEDSIDFEPIEDAAITPSGKTYTRKNLEKSIEVYNKEPDTMLDLSVENVRSNHIINLIRQICEEAKNDPFYFNTLRQLLVCPVSAILFKNPIVLEDGYTYEAGSKKGIKGYTNRLLIEIIEKLIALADLKTENINIENVIDQLMKIIVDHHVTPKKDIYSILTANNDKENESVKEIDKEKESEKELDREKENRIKQHAAIGQVLSSYINALLSYNTKRQEKITVSDVFWGMDKTKKSLAIQELISALTGAIKVSEIPNNHIAVLYDGKLHDIAQPAIEYLTVYEESLKHYFKAPIELNKEVDFREKKQAAREKEERTLRASLSARLNRLTSENTSSYPVEEKNSNGLRGSSN